MIYVSRDPMSNDILAIRRNQTDQTFRNRRCPPSMSWHPSCRSLMRCTRLPFCISRGTKVCKRQHMSHGAGKADRLLKYKLYTAEAMRCWWESTIEP